MKQEEAKQRVRALFREWAALNKKRIPHTEPEGGFVFYGWLGSNHPEALDFRSAGDKWQTVHGWLLQAKLVSR